MSGYIISSPFNFTFFQNRLFPGRIEYHSCVLPCIGACCEANIDNKGCIIWGQI